MRLIVALECAASWSVRWNARVRNCVPGLLLSSRRLDRAARESRLPRWRALMSSTRDVGV
jgi:hypothetical protein